MRILSPHLALSAIVLSASVAAAQGLKVGAAAPSLTFTASDTTTRTVDPSQATATVLIFVANQCPVSNAYSDRMRALYTSYADKPVQFVFADADVTESFRDIASFETRAKFPFKIVRDVDDKVADQLGAQVTPEVFIFDKTGTLQYHGSIDDSRNASHVTQQPARDAIDELLAGKPVTVKSTKVFGCTITRRSTP